MPIDDERFARIAKALADPRRFQILEEIANCREVGCQRLCEQFPVAQPTMSHHLKELARAGLIEPWREGHRIPVLPRNRLASWERGFASLYLRDVPFRSRDMAALAAGPFGPRIDRMAPVPGRGYLVANGTVEGIQLALPTQQASVEVGV